MRNGVIIILLMPLVVPVYAQQDTLPSIPMQQLEEVEIHSGYEKYRTDSINTYTIYRKHIKDAQIKLKPEFAKEAIRAGEIGLIMPGAVSELASRVSGQKKKDKRLLRCIERDMEDKYISIRYHEDVIKAVTGLQGDSVLLFLKAYPMSLNFARSASPLELKMWIRNNFKQWLNRPKDSLQVAPPVKE